MMDGFIKIYRSIKSYNSAKSSLKTWMSRIFVNTCLDYLKLKGKMFNESFVGLEGASDLSIELENLSASDLLNQMSDMPKGYLVVFNLYAIEGYDHKEISDMLKISPSTSRSQFYRAKKWLQTNYKKLSIAN